MSDQGPLTRLRIAVTNAIDAHDLEALKKLEKLAAGELLNRWLRALTFTELHVIRAEIAASIKCLEIGELPIKPK